MRKMIRWLVLGGAITVLATGCDSGNDRHIEPEPPGTEISGRAAQVYVAGATVVADRIGVAGLGNFMVDPDEAYGYSDADGRYRFEVPADYTDYLLFSAGGTVTDSTGEPRPALPMLAPAGSANITPVTTLVALAPSLEEKLGDAAFDADVAAESGADWRVMQLAKLTEAVLTVLAAPDHPLVVNIADQIAITEYLAAEFVYERVNLSDDNTLIDAVYYGVTNALFDTTIVFPESVYESDPYGIASIFADCAEEVLSAIPNTGLVVEADILATTEAAMARAVTRLAGNALRFNPDASIIPFPNDIAWAETGGAVAFPVPDDDPAAAALYTAVNALSLKGFSPNAPIAIPLENETAIDPAALSENIRLVNLKALTGVLYAALSLGNPMTANPETISAEVAAGLAGLDAAGRDRVRGAVAAESARIFDARVKVTQAGRFIKIYPLTPLSPDAPYMVFIEGERVDPVTGDLTLFTDINGIRVSAPPYYKLLKSDESLTGSTAALEPLRRQYAPLFHLFLPALGTDPDEVLMLFTFTTADRTLSTDDFAAIAGYLAGAVPTLNELAAAVVGAPNLPYTDGAGTLTIGAEYAAVESQIPPMTAVDLPAPGHFVSVDIASPSLDQTAVPYALFNGDAYTGEITIFQHGFTRQKSDAAALTMGLPMPILAMDLPLHGDRTTDGLTSGADFLTPNLPQDRLNFYQSYFDMTVMLRNLAAGLFDLDGDGVRNLPGEAITDPDDQPDRIHFLGQSLGAITGSVFTSRNADTLDRIALSVGGANFSSLVDEATSAEIQGLTESLGVERNTTPYFAAMGLVQTIFDPADPVFLAGPAAADRTIIQSAYGDTVVPNTSNEILAHAIGHPEPVRVTTFDSAPAAEAGWYLYGGVPGREANWVNHGFLLYPRIDGYPEAPGKLDETYVLEAHQAAMAQINAFLQ
jgi:hypothetical protein